MRPLFYLVALGTTALTLAACAKKSDETAAPAGTAAADAATSAQTPNGGPAPKTGDPGLVPVPPGSPPPPGTSESTTVPEGGTTTPQGGPPPVQPPPQ